MSAWEKGSDRRTEGEKRADEWVLAAVQRGEFLTVDPAREAEVEESLEREFQEDLRLAAKLCVPIGIIRRGLTIDLPGIDVVMWRRSRTFLTAEQAVPERVPMKSQILVEEAA